MNSCIIIGALAQTVKTEPQDFILAADGGYLVAQQQGIMPDMMIGDWDSAPKPKTDKMITLPKEKDDTDTHFAAKWALDHGFRHIKIYGAIGGRLDHTLANLQTLYYLAEQKAQAVLFGEGAEAYLLTAEQKNMTIPNREGWYLSVFSYGEKATGVSIRNAYYCMENGTLEQSFPLGVSNEFAGKDVEIAVQTGNLLILLIRK